MKPCKIWTGYTKKGYGIVRRIVDGKSRQVRLHRWLWEKTYGPIPPGYEPDHLCRNKACYELEHLEIVTHQENMRRADWDSRRTPTCPKGHIRTPENIYMRKDGRRRCAECSRQYTRERKHAA